MTSPVFIYLSCRSRTLPSILCALNLLQVPRKPSTPYFAEKPKIRLLSGYRSTLITRHVKNQCIFVEQTNMSSYEFIIVW